MFVGVKKNLCLGTTEVVQTAIHTTPLHNTPQVKIGLSVTDNVYFFGVQFLSYCGLPSQTGAKIGKCFKHHS
jgi:hypothetical protein